MQFDSSVYRRVIREGFDHWCNHGPAKIQCPYTGDRAGAWNFGRTKARDGFSYSDTWNMFREMEGI